MPLTPADIRSWCIDLIGSSEEIPPLEDCLDAIPDLDSLEDLPAGTRVLVRGDTDVSVADDGTIADDTRLRSLVDTLSYGLGRGWVQLVYGHRGRDPDLSLAPLADHLQSLVPEDSREGRPVVFLGEWLDDATGEVLPRAAEQVAALSEGSIAVLENTRRYSLERALWKAEPGEIDELLPRLTAYANTVAERLGRVHVNEGFAASNRDLSSTLVPLACERVALGRFVSEQLRRHVTRTRLAELVIFSGIKINKLDDLEQILDRGRVRMVIAAGGIALALKQAEAQAAGRTFEPGLAGDPTNEKIYIPQERTAQAMRIYGRGVELGIEFVLPIDFLLGNGSSHPTIPRGEAQFDIGPATIEHQAAAVGRFLEYHDTQVAAGRPPAVAFHNGVFGLFEEQAFETGTREFIGQLRRMKERGVEVYVGGGEGSTALKRYGEPDWVTHCFTAGGTILKALGNEPIPYLKALFLRARSLQARSGPPVVAGE